MLTTRFAHNRSEYHAAHPISEEDMRRLAPSVFAESAHESRSARYSYIPTIEVLRGLRANGFEPFYTVQAQSRKEDHRTHTKHMIRLRHADQITARGEDVNEVILINSHNGTSSYQMLAGCFRSVCCNSLVCGITQADIRVKHSGKALDEVIEGAFGILQGFSDVDASKDALKSLRLTSGEQTAYANAAIALRFGTEKEPPVRAAQILQPRRVEDQDNTLWLTFQRAQEHLVQGGLRTNDRTRRTRTRAITGIDGNVALNRGLWVLAEEMRKIRNAA